LNNSFAGAATAAGVRLLTRSSIFEREQALAILVVMLYAGHSSIETT
jgi:hypothetical protein